MFYLHKINLYFTVGVNHCPRKSMSTLINVDVSQRPNFYVAICLKIVLMFYCVNLLIYYLLFIIIYLLFIINNNFAGYDVCNEDEFLCNNNACISMHHRCDGYINCLDQSDEAGCS